MARPVLSHIHLEHSVEACPLLPPNLEALIAGAGYELSAMPFITGILFLHVLHTEARIEPGTNASGSWQSTRTQCEDEQQASSNIPFSAMKGAMLVFIAVALLGSTGASYASRIAQPGTAESFTDCKTSFVPLENKRDL